MTNPLTLGHGLIVADIDDLTRTEWLALRRTGVGGSDLAKIAGVSNWGSALSLWNDKTGTVPDVDEAGEAADWGRRFEDPVAAEFESRHGVAINDLRVTVRHPEHEFMLANIDRVVWAQPELVEIKTRRDQRRWQDGPPLDVELQCRHYLACTGFERCHVAALFWGQEYKEWVIERDEQTEAAVIRMAAEFWRLVVDRIPPVAGGDDGKILAAMYPGADGVDLVADDDMVALLKERANLVEFMREPLARKAEIEAHVKQTIADGHRLVADDGDKLAAWSIPKQSDGKFDEAAFREDCPELWEEYRFDRTFDWPAFSKAHPRMAKVFGDEVGGLCRLRDERPKVFLEFSTPIMSSRRLTFS